MGAARTLEAVLRRDRLIVLGGLAGLIVLAWAYLVRMAAGMDLAAVAGVQLQPWSAADFVLRFLMWAIMMVGMMLPSAAPMILLYARVERRQRRGGQPFTGTSAFVLGYVAVWTAFSLVATGAQWGLEQAALLSPMMVSTSPVLGGLLLIGAGIYQWTAAKDVCLEHCRSPLGFLMAHWRTGVGGALRMGLGHGAFCLGCCWLLMALLFVGGVMNLLWVAAIAAFVLIEKVAPYGEWIGRVSGVLLAAAGVLMIDSG